MKDEKYSGWTNYETWNVKLWIDNDESGQQYWNEQAQEAYDRAEAETDEGAPKYTKKENAAFELRDQLKDYFEESNPLPDAGMYTDLLNAALSLVNWYEIAENLLEDVEEEAKV